MKCSVVDCPSALDCLSALDLFALVKLLSVGKQAACSKADAGEYTGCNNVGELKYRIGGACARWQ